MSFHFCFGFDLSNSYHYLNCVKLSGIILSPVKTALQRWVFTWASIHSIKYPFGGENRLNRLEIKHWLNVKLLTCRTTAHTAGSLHCTGPCKFGCIKPLVLFFWGRNEHLYIRAWSGPGHFGLIKFLRWRVSGSNGWYCTGVGLPVGRPSIITCPVGRKV